MVATVPKEFPADVKLLAVRLYLDCGNNASRAARELKLLRPDWPASATAIAGWASGFNPKTKRGRPANSQDLEPRAPRSDTDHELRARAAAAYEQHGSLRKAGAALGLSGERIRQLLVKPSPQQ